MWPAILRAVIRAIMGASSAGGQQPNLSPFAEVPTTQPIAAATEPATRATAVAMDQPTTREITVAADLPAPATRPETRPSGDLLVDIPPGTRPSPATRPAVAANAATEPSFADADPRDTLPFLASDALDGRGIGSTGLDEAADFIGGEFAAHHLSPVNGQADFFQRFEYAVSYSPGPGTKLQFAERPLVMGMEFAPLGLSAAGDFSGGLAFAGYGISAPESNYDDYAGIDVRGKVVLAFRFEPVDEHGRSRLLTESDASGWSPHAALAAKAKTAAEHGAVALLVVTPPISVGSRPTPNSPDPLIPFTGMDAAAIPVIQVRQTVADRLCRAAGLQTLADLRAAIDTTGQPHSAVGATPGFTVRGAVQIDRRTVNIRNVMAEVRGAGPTADQFVIVGAHYDHLGHGQLGHQIGPVGPIYHGADDNASGTATVLDLAARFAAGPPPPRSILFVCFTAEEEGLIGSKYFVAHPPVPLDQVVAMLNLDMVGRLQNELLYVGGQGTAPAFDAILADADAHSPLKLKSIGRGGLGPSDHQNFALHHIPVMFFFTGLHGDYHSPTDVTARINFDGLDQIDRLCQATIDDMLKMPRQDYVLAADEDSMGVLNTPGGLVVPTRHVMLGVIPDIGAADSRVGLLITGVTPNSPAARAGLQNGDLIVRIDNSVIENLMDLNSVLIQRRPGDRVKIKVLRGDQTLYFDVTLVERTE